MNRNGYEMCMYQIKNYNSKNNGGVHCQMMQYACMHAVDINMKKVRRAQAGRKINEHRFSLQYVGKK